MKGGNGEKDEWYLALLPLPPILLFGLFFLLNDRQYLTTTQQLTGAVLTLLLCGGVYGVLRVLLRRSARLKRLLRAHGPYILVLLLLILIKFQPNISNINYMWAESYGIHDYLLEKFSVIEYHQFPLWNPFIWSGSPSHAIGDRYYFYPPAIPFIFLPTTLAMNLTTILNVAFAGILMYGLVVHLSKSEQAGLVSALVFVFSAWWVTKSQWLFFHITFPMALVPAIFFTFVMLTKQERLSGFVKWGAAAGILLGLQVQSGNPEYFLYTGYFIVGVYLVVSLLTTPRLRKRIPLLVIAGIAIVSICVSISAVKLLPATKFLEMTNRGGEWGGEEHPSSLKWGSPLDIFGFLIRSSWTQLAKWGLGRYSGEYAVYQNEETGEIGLIGFVLALLALSKIRKRYVLALSASAFIAIIVMLNYPIYNLLRALFPLLNRFHVAGRALTLFIFAGAVLSGIGWTVISEKIPKRWQKRAFFILVSLIILDLIILGNPRFPLQPGFEWLEENHIMQDLSKREGLFRVSSFDVKGIDRALHPLTLPLKIQYNQGLDGLLWINDYMEYLIIAHSFPSRFWGMLNIKYVTSAELVNESGFTFEKTFEKCSICNYPPAAGFKGPNPPTAGYDGPHLYTNDNVLPRAYTVDNAILVTGEWADAKNIVYGLMAHQDFNPRTTVIISDPRRLSEMRGETLFSYRAVIPVSLDNSDLGTLSAMKDAGIRILPDILAGEDQIGGEDLGTLLREFGGNVTAVREAPVELYTPNVVKVGPVGGSGFLVLAEKYALFEGDWRASAGGERRNMLRANAVGTAISLEGLQGETLTFSYLPPSFVIGAILSTIGLLAGIVLIWQPWNKLLSQKKKPKKKKGAA